MWRDGKQCERSERGRGRTGKGFVLGRKEGKSGSRGAGV